MSVAGVVEARGLRWVILSCVILAGCARTELSPSPEPSEVELHGYYESHRAEFMRDERRRVRHLLLAPGAKAEAERLLAKLRPDSGRFEALVLAHSLDAETRARGGDLGATSRADLEARWGAELAHAVFALNGAHEVTAVETPAGIHLVLMTGKLHGAARSFEQVKGRLRQRLLAERRAVRAEVRR
jgi:parvulin-like peptidyl-prolyl isomerase